jgi:hypothetical protein
MAKQSSVNLDITNNADGFDISGGTTPRKLGITGGDVTIAGSGSATVTFPTTSTTIAGLGITQSFSALQSFSAGISAAGATFSGNISAPNIVNSFNGLTGAVQGVSQVNGLTGAIINVGLTSGKLSQFASTTSAELAGVISNETGGGGLLVFNLSPSISTSITTATSTFALVNTVATTLNFGGAATTLTMGGTSGTASIRNSTLLLGNTNNTITTNNGTTNYLNIQPYGNLTLAPLTTAISLGGTVPSLTVSNTVDGAGQVQILGGDLALGTKSTNGFNSLPVNIIFEGALDNTNETTLTVVDPTADRTISLPDASGIVALTNSVVTTVNGLTSAITITGSGAITQTVSGTTTTFGARLASATVTGVASFGNEFVVTSGAVGLTSNYVKSINGSTGAVANVARTNVDNNFSVAQTIDGPGTYLEIINSAANTAFTLTPGTGIVVSDSVNFPQTLQFAQTGTTTTVTLPSYTTTLAGLSGNQTFTALNTFNAGISAAGGVTFAGTFSGATGSFSKLLSASAGISASGTTAATFNGTVNCNSSTVYNPTLQYYNEPYATPSITGNVLTVDLRTAQVFGVTLNSPISTFTISNTPATANRSIGFTLILTADGTARGITWGAPVKWSGGVTPTTTITNGKKDIFTFMTINGGTEWLGFIAGQNF